MTSIAVDQVGCFQFAGDKTLFQAWFSRLKNELMKAGVWAYAQDIVEKPTKPTALDATEQNSDKIRNHHMRLRSFEDFRAKRAQAFGIIRTYLSEAIVEITMKDNRGENPKVALDNLKATYALDPSRHDHRRAIEIELEQAGMKPGESFDAWYTRFIILAMRAGLDLLAKRKYFETPNYLLPHLAEQWRHNSVNELDWETGIERLRNRDNYFMAERSTKKVKKVKAKDDVEEDSEDAGSEVVLQRAEKLPYCKNCEVRGHNIWNCIAGFCRNCKMFTPQLNHLPKDCTKLKARSVPPQSSTIKPLPPRFKNAAKAEAVFKQKKKKKIEKKVVRQVRFSLDDEEDEGGADEDDGEGSDPDHEIPPDYFDDGGDDDDDEDNDFLNAHALAMLRGSSETKSKKICMVKKVGYTDKQLNRVMKLDSGADISVVPGQDWLCTEDSTSKRPRLETATAETMSVTGFGDVSRTIRDVAVSEDSTEALLATLPLQDDGHTIVLLPTHTHPELGAIVYDEDMTPVLIANKRLEVDLDISQQEIDAIMLDPRLGKWKGATRVVRRLKGTQADRNLDELYRFVHESLGHPSYETLRRIAELRCIEDFPLSLEQVIRHRQPCLACVKGKLTRASLKPRSRSTLSPDTDRLSDSRELKLCSDILGPLPKGSGSGSKTYAITFTSSNTGYVSVFIVDSKTELLSSLKSVLEEYRRVGKHSSNPNSPISILQSDSEAVYMDKDVDALLKTEGIRHQASAPYVHQQNGVAERMHRTIGDVVATLYAAAPWIPKEFWPYAVRHAAYCINLHPRRHAKKTPYEDFHGRRPSFTLHPLMPFGQAVEFYVPSEIRTWKFSARSSLGAYLGPAFKSKHAIRVLHMENKRVVTTFSYWLHREMSLQHMWQFDIGPMFVGEDFEEPAPALPGGDGGGDGGGELPGTLDPNHGIRQGPMTLPQAQDQVQVQEPNLPEDVREERRGIDTRPTVGVLDGGSAEGGASGGQVTGLLSGSILSNPSSDSIIAEMMRANPTTAPMVRGTEKSQTGHMLPDVTVPSAHTDRPSVMPQAISTTTAPLPTSAPSQSSVNADLVSRSTPSTSQGGVTHPHFLRSSNFKILSVMEVKAEKAGAIFEEIISNTFKVLKVMKRPDNPSMKQALNSKDKLKWKEAINKELQQLRDMNVYSLIDSFPPWARPVRTHFVLKASRDAAGVIFKYKARLVGQGNHQDPSTYDLVQSPTARSAAVRLLVALAVHRGKKVESFDVPGAYLNSKTSTAKTTKGDPNLYIILPDGTKGKLEKFLYGLKQSGLEWHHTVKEFLFNLGYVQSPAEPCLFVWREGSGAEGSALGARERFHMLVIYVDDFLAFGSDDHIQDCFYLLLREKFGDVPRKQGNFTFLSIEIQQNEDGSAKMCMPGYCRKLIEEYGLEDCKPVTNPDYSGRPPEDDEPGDEKEFMRMLGSLMYLACSVRFDLLCVLSRLASKAKKPSKADNLALKRVLRYVKGTAEMGIVYRPTDEIRLACKVDAAFDSEPMGRSRSGMMFSLGRDAPAFHAKSTKQVMVAQSSTEAEYIALYEAVLEIIWLRYLLADMGYPQAGPTSVFEDNASCIQIAGGAGAHQRTKHFARRLHYTRQMREDGLIELHHLNTDQMTADVLTKALPDKDFRRHCLSLLGE